MVSPTWITDLVKLDNKLTFNDLILPGTHNSCAYSFDTSLISATHSPLLRLPCISYFIENWTKNQSLNLYDQLKVGVRVFNIDVSYYNNEFYTSHTFLINKLNTDLQQIQNYSIKHNDFIVLSFILQDIPSDKIPELEEKIKFFFDSVIIYPSQYNDPLNVPLNKFMNEQKNILIYFEKDSNYHLFYSKNLMQLCSWENVTNSTQYKIKCKETLLEYNEIKHNSSNIFCDLNWTLTPRKEQIISSINCCNRYRDLKEWILPFNKELNMFLDTNKQLIKKVNSISIDFADEKNIEDIINFQLFN